MTPAEREVLIKKIDYVITELALSENYMLNRSVEMFVSLKKRVFNKSKLTKKERLNLAWIKENVV